MDPFSIKRVPYIVLCNIIRQIPDWVTLENLIEASPRIREIFEPGKDPNERAEPAATHIVDIILKGNPITKGHLYRHFWRVTELKQLTPEELQESFSEAHSSLRRSGLNEGEPERRSLTEFLARHKPPTSISRAVLWEMIHIAANIQRLACACLTFLGGLLQAHFYWNGRFHAMKELDLSQPSWEEEYRVYRALWHLQLYSVLHKGDILPVDGHIVCVRGQYQPEVATWDLLPGVARVEIQTVSQCLLNLVNGNHNLNLNGWREWTNWKKWYPLVTELPDASRLEFGFPTRSPPPQPSCLRGVIDPFVERLKAYAVQNKLNFKKSGLELPHSWHIPGNRMIGLMMWDVRRLNNSGLWPLRY
ncbi:hypothetical protein BO79DRAFT_251676 [Aspergillus costaricaensis CBS 115574]|uniref:Uncharacterized protein n=1 Tax=Aspergillus costaricaensis CBS 115574 TaxID=1448317 RepID=A0ACD1IRU5_9EURO|nr:hypothetical protein BO79DRAFT_251676 [Aspergillus costaricaensis CBS 115574]RAK92392.1 hypothetical protein BO79DRAFT_251676 [Aspergillus costaricaensis CBS 115574]